MNTSQTSMAPDTTPSASRARPTVMLAPHEVSQILEIYRPEHQYVSNAGFADGSLHCDLTLGHYPYTRRQIFHYVTAPTATICVCQVAYVFIGGIVLKCSKLQKELGLVDWIDFTRNRDAASLRFARFDVQFRREVKAMHTIPASMWLTRVRKFKGWKHCVMEFTIGDGISGKIHGAMTI
jgi:hypothetical protein